MTKKIRHNVFETNSSSTHSICVAKDTNVEFPASIHFESGEFGWENDTLTSIYEKASYLFTAFMCTEHKDEWQNVVNKLRSKNIHVTYQESGDYGYIDHGYDLSEFVNDMEYEEEKLFSFLFSPLSFIITGNDNDDVDVDIKVPYEYYEYYKGN